MNIKHIMQLSKKIILLFLMTLTLTGAFMQSPVKAGTLQEVIKSGTLRHLGIPYANFITQDHVGLDVELMQQFAHYLGVEYQFIESTWQDIIPDLTGQTIKVAGNNVEITGTQPIRGDIISTGFTILPWRTEIISFSEETFPSGIWLIARSDATLEPIRPSGNIHQDIKNVKKKLRGVSVLGLKESCLAPSLYGIKETGAKIQLFPADLDLEQMIPSVIAQMVDTTLMDVPVALVALAKWPGKIKVIGPLSDPQEMACAFSKDAPDLKRSFDSFFRDFKKSGEYRRLVTTYYPTVFTYYPDFLLQN